MTPVLIDRKATTETMPDYVYINSLVELLKIVDKLRTPND
jgi:hypothetical protein